MTRTERPSYRRDWEDLSKHYAAYEAAYERLVTPATITVWNSDGTFGLGDLGVALQIRSYFAGKDDPVARKFLSRARAVSDAVLAANLFERPPAGSLFPQNRGRTKYLKAYADALLDDAPLDRQLCCEAAFDLAEYASRLPKKKWDADAQNELQSAVETLLLTGAREEAVGLIAKARGMSGMWVKERFAFAQRFAAMRAYPVRDDALRRDYLWIFDEMRNPLLPAAVAQLAFPVNALHCLTLAALYQKYFESGDSTFAWGRALELMSE